MLKRKDVLCSWINGLTNIKMLIQQIDFSFNAIYIKTPTRKDFYFFVEESGSAVHKCSKYN